MCVCVCVCVCINVCVCVYLIRLKGHPGVDKNEVRAIAGPLMDMLTKR